MHPSVTILDAVKPVASSYVSKSCGNNVTAQCDSDVIDLQATGVSWHGKT